MSNYPPRDYEHKAVYRARVDDQKAFKAKKDGKIYVVLTCELLAKLKNPRKPALGDEPLPEALRKGKDALLNFSGDRAGESFQILRSLGFEDANVFKLDPYNPDHVSLIDEQIFLEVSYSEDKQKEGQEKEWWNVKTFNTAPVDYKKLWDEEQEALVELHAQSLTTTGGTY